MQIELKRLKTRTSTDTPVRTLNSLNDNAHTDDAVSESESPVPESPAAPAADPPADVTVNNVSAATASSNDQPDDAVTENDVSITPPEAAAAGATVPTTSMEICPPSDDEEDTENDSGILKNNTHLFDSI
jgi:hypothetical protein